MVCLVNLNTDTIPWKCWDGYLLTDVRAEATAHNMQDTECHLKQDSLTWNYNCSSNQLRRWASGTNYLQIPCPVVPETDVVGVVSCYTTQGRCLKKRNNNQFHRTQNVSGWYNWWYEFNTFLKTSWYYHLWKASWQHILVIKINIQRKIICHACWISDSFLNILPVNTWQIQTEGVQEV